MTDAVAVIPALITAETDAVAVFRWAIAADSEAVEVFDTRIAAAILAVADWAVTPAQNNGIVSGANTCHGFSVDRKSVV